MSIRLSFALILLCCAFPLQSEAGKYNPDRSIGDQFAGFESLPATDGKTYSSSDFEDARALVIVFTCNSCPYALDYEERLKAFEEKWGSDQRVQLVAINCNLVPSDSLEKIKERDEEQGFNFIYLFDESQQTGKALGALRTPECFVLDQDRKIVYMGAFDDSTNAAEVETRYVENAVEAVLRGNSPVPAETPPIGCLIRYKRRR
ncbi:thioredoxin family protein [Rubinisphaera margarita]|uniref:thioredoxin family protein n=1 Tax=Rubinisphaera margarita TaxID=2909586 RepID=UPI001EE8639C|nr:thioredoxin family protein [Rubinisphaera margarita]MCG6156082.1 thioredoxin family protein [Rubinisphaera margarita]